MHLLFDQKIHIRRQDKAQNINVPYPSLQFNCPSGKVIVEHMACLMEPHIKAIATNEKCPLLASSREVLYIERVGVLM